MDAVVIVTDHSAVSYRKVAENAHLVVDTRGVMRGYEGSARVVGLSGEYRSAPVAEASIAAD
jgi:UDP-N-acetyl-D-mannosaminuronate dehydrogenase